MDKEEGWTNLKVNLGQKCECGTMQQACGGHSVNLRVDKQVYFSTKSKNIKNRCLFFCLL